MRPQNGPAEQLPLPLHPTAYGLPPQVAKPGLDPKSSSNCKKEIIGKSNSRKKASMEDTQRVVPGSAADIIGIMADLRSAGFEPTGLRRNEHGTFDILMGASLPPAPSAQDARAPVALASESGSAQAELIKGLHIVPKTLADGKKAWYFYLRRGCGASFLTVVGDARPQLTDKVLEVIRKAREAETQKLLEQRPPILEDLISAWRGSVAWRQLGAQTRNTWGSALNAISAALGAEPLDSFDNLKVIRPKIMRWRDSRQDTPRAADTGIQALQALLKFGNEEGSLSHNAADKIRKLYETGQRADIIWTDEDILAFATAAGEENRHVVDAILLCACTGLRRADLISLTWRHVEAYAIKKKAMKKSGRRGRRRHRFAIVPRTPELDRVLERLATRHRASGVTRVLVTEEGRPWTGNALTTAVGGIVRMAGIVHVDLDDENEGAEPIYKHLHDVRGTFVTRLVTQTDLTDAEIAEVMAWRPEDVLRIRRLYVDDCTRIMALSKRIARGGVNRAVNQLSKSASNQP